MRLNMLASHGIEAACTNKMGHVNVHSRWAVSGDADFFQPLLSLSYFYTFLLISPYGILSSPTSDGRCGVAGSLADVEMKWTLDF